LSLKINSYICNSIIIQYTYTTMIKFILDPRGGIPYYRQIIDQIRFGIASGKLSVGEQLPTVRSLAVELKVNLNTVAKAYKELEIQNILGTYQGTGTFINRSETTLSDKERQNKMQEICREFMTIAFTYGLTIDDMIQELQKQQ
jgi:GntR family transcriptional regulator